MLACGGGANRPLAMQGGGEGDVHSVDVWIIQNRLVTAVRSVHLMRRRESDGLVKTSTRDRDRMRVVRQMHGTDVLSGDRRGSQYAPAADFLRLIHASRPEVGGNKDVGWRW